MSTIRKLALLAGLALAALAVTAGTATAQETEVEVVEEQGHVPCVECPIHMAGEHLITDGMGNPIITCEDELTGVINADGSGEVEWSGTAHGGSGCTIANCASPEHHWTLRDLGELETGEEHITLDFCLHGAGGDVHCTAEAHIADESLHHYVLSLTNAPCGGALISSQWEIEGTDLELEHRED